IPSPAARLSPLPPSPPLVPSPSPIPIAPALRDSERAKQPALASLEAAHLLAERPRWVSACIALVVCVTASAAGASLVRNLKQHRRSQALPAQTVAAPVVTAPTAQS